MPIQVQTSQRGTRIISTPPKEAPVFLGWTYAAAVSVPILIVGARGEVWLALLVAMIFVGVVLVGVLLSVLTKSRSLWAIAGEESIDLNHEWVDVRRRLLGRTLWDERFHIADMSDLVVLPPGSDLYGPWPWGDGALGRATLYASTWRASWQFARGAVRFTYVDGAHYLGVPLLTRPERDELGRLLLQHEAQFRRAHGMPLDRGLGEFDAMRAGIAEARHQTGDTVGSPW